jgi:hypothetical protein
MPAKSAKQQRFMGMCYANPEKVKGKCPPKKVAREFARKPKGGYGKDDKRRVKYY